MLAWLADL